MAGKTQRQSTDMFHWTPDFALSTWRMMYVSTYVVFWIDNGGTWWALQQWFYSIIPAAQHNQGFIIGTWILALILTAIMLSSLRYMIFKGLSGYYEKVKKNLSDTQAHDRNAMQSPINWMANFFSFVLNGQGIVTLLFAYGSDVYAGYRIFDALGMNDVAGGATQTSQAIDIAVILILPLIFICWSLFGPMLCAHLREHVRHTSIAHKVEEKIITEHLKKTIKFDDDDIEALQAQSTPHILPGLSQFAWGNNSNPPPPKF